MAHAADVPNYDDLEELGIDLDEVTEKFTQAADHLKKLVAKLDDKTLLVLYGYYKQGLEGPCNSPKPSWYNTKGRAKWEAWNKLGDMPQAEAKTLYTQLVESLDPEFLSSPKEGWVSISTMQPDEDVLNESEKSLVDYVKEGNCIKVADILRSYSAENVASVVNKLDDEGMGLIHWAADRGSPEVLKVILSFGGDVNFVDSDMQTPLHYAASCGHLACITVLLENKADVSLKDADGLEPSAVASDESVRELLKSSA